jgi:hypothetical protein
LHALDVKHEAPIEDLEGERWLATENKDFVLSYLVGKTHVGGDPARFIDERAWNLLPHITRNVIALNSINDLLLVDAAAERKDVIVLEGTETDACAWYLERVNFLPLVLLSVILLAVAINDIIDEGADNVDKAINAADWVISVCFVHVGHADESREDLIVTEARIQVHIIMLDIATSQIDSARLSGDRSWVERHFELHVDLLLLKDASLDPEQLTAPLIPLKAVQSLWENTAKRRFDIVVNAEVFLN